MLYKVIADPQCVGEEPPDGDRPPDPCDADGRHSRERIGESHPGAQGHDCEDHGHARLPESAVQPVEQEQDPDQRVESALDAKIPHTLGDDSALSGIDEQSHQRLREDEDHEGNDQAEGHGSDDSRTDAPADPFVLLCTEILGDEDREGISEILDRQIGKCIDLYRRCKCSHDRCTETVDQSLDSQDPQIHNGLLEAGQRRKAGDLLYTAQAQADVLIPPEQMREADTRVERDPNSGYILGDDGSLGSSGNAPVKSCNEPEIQRDVEPGRDREKSERDHGISQGAQERGEKVVEKYADEPGKDHAQVFFHHAHEPVRRAKEPDDMIDPCKDQDIQHDRHETQEDEGGEDSFFEPALVLLAEADREDSAAPHGKPEDNGGQKCHKGKGGSHCRQRVRAEEAPYDQGIRNIVALLQKVA